MSRARCAALVTVVALAIATLSSGRAIALAAPASTVDRVAANAVQQPAAGADEDTPWGFFSKNVGKADTFWKWVELILFTILFSGLYAALYLPFIAIGVAVLALISSRVRDSRLVRGGLVLYFGGLAALFIAGRFNDNPLGFGFLYSITRPIGAVMMVAGAALALIKKVGRT